MKSDLKHFVLRMPPDIYAAAKDCQYKQHEKSFADFLRVVLKSYLEDKGYNFVPVENLSLETFFETSKETSITKATPTPGAWETATKWEND